MSVHRCIVARSARTTPAEGQGARRSAGDALASGRVFDTADVSGGGHNERFLAEVLGAERRRIVLATNFGAAREGAGYRVNCLTLRTSL
jgi:aryl-alcohol dehydrogenase-like predicted oxidoreductase